MKKLLVRGGLAIGTLGVVLAGAAALSAFEAHVVNVTATIENALAVNTTPVDFGNVFPQEYLTRDIVVGLSDSFLSTDRVDDVEYVIKQKPKVKEPCFNVSPVVFLDKVLGIKTANAQQAPCDPNVNPTPGDPYATIHVVGIGDNQTHTFDGPAWQFCEEYLPEGAPYTNVNLNDPYWKYCYLPLADDLSKHSSVATDHSVDAFHHAYQWSEGESSLVPANIASGRLSKNDQVTQATWTIDLKVPCFVGQCAQEASDPTNTVNDGTPGFYVPTEFRLPTTLEHKTFGTDLWIEVTGISTNHTLLGSCGVLQTQGLATGEETSQASYDYVFNADGMVAGNTANHHWIDLPGTNTEAVWDMGSAQSQVWLVPSIDHGPVPGENNETLIYYGDTATGPWTLATRIGEDPTGPSNWISDDGMGKWQFSGSHQFVRALSSGSDVTASNAQGLFISDDTEIDAVCSVAVQ